jgi:hypothetical protein
MTSTEKLLTKFHALTKTEQEVLLALSVMFVPIGQTQLQRALRASSHIKPLAYKIVVKPLKDKLESAGLIVISSDGWRCHSDLSEVLIKIALRERSELFVKLVQYRSTQHDYVTHKSRIFYMVRDLRFFLYSHDYHKFSRLFLELMEQFSDQSIDALDLLFFDAWDAEWFKSLVPEFRYFVLSNYIELSAFELQDNSLQVQLLQSSLEAGDGPVSQLRQTLAEHYLVQGQVQRAEALISDDMSAYGLSIQAGVCFMANRNDEALILYHAALKLIKKQTRKRNVCLPGLHGFLFNLALLKNGEAENITFLKKQLQISIKVGNSGYFSRLNHYLSETVDVYQAQYSAQEAGYLPEKITGYYAVLFRHLMLYWLDEQSLVIETSLKFIEDACLRAEQVGNHFYAAVSATLLQRLGVNKPNIEAIAEKYQGASYLHIVDLIPKVEKWERALQALTQLSGTGGNTDTAIAKVRMIWLLTLSDVGATLEPREQKMGKTGRWTKGRPVALKRLRNSLEDFGYLSDQDRRICAHIEMHYESNYYSYHRTEIYSLGGDALIAAAGHPNIYWVHADKYDAPITINKAEPHLLVSKKAKHLLISLHPQIADESVVIERAANDELLVYQISEQHHQVANILGAKGLSVPHQAKQQVIDSIAAIAATLTVQSDIEGVAQNVASVEVDSRLHVHIQPVGEGLQIEVFVQPFTDTGPIYKPGTGGATVFAEVEGKQLQTVRDFSVEIKHLEQLQQACPELYQTKEAKWILDNPEIALAALLQLQDVADFAVLEWPKGQKIKVSREAGLGQAHFSVRKEKDWFSVEGQVQIDDEQVYDMQRLIHLLQATSGRFLKLDDGQFIALSNELRQRLDDISGLGEQKGKKLQFHALAAPALNEALEGMQVKAGKQWKDQLKKLESMAELEPELPSTLQGELRDYQLEGYQWLARLAHWGAGACLADDMGLGKTIQALALILARAAEGPTLILAPTSVCMNWLDEAQHFAPTLNMQQFGTGNRQQIIAQAAEFDVIVCSYGLLQTEAELLVDKQWHTIVADEAQAIKNSQTKRSQAAMALQADFKVITTGTPIENHLGELWNLFHFINPGLLGSLQKFNQRYAQAIENDKDHATQQRLKKLLRPFILRRLKNDVLKELPAKTEITLHVELSQEERTFYEAMRRNAVDAMQAIEQEGQQAGQQHLQILAEIMKLRRACCHPRLVMEDSPLSSAKLQAFEELVTELIEGRHKVLVFSQFVGHLAIIKEMLDEKGIHYQYLDGSTPIAKRKKAVNAFQAGKGDVFLISLKAGGSGLNLTAADYVIHMDPWWNPAVEDQASDRAHRMGQKRPVTIYRLVAKDTIEDKIVDLHTHKRDLANSLLEGGEVSGKMSVGDMMALLRETAD